jgi:hypothetical protein
MKEIKLPIYLFVISFVIRLLFIFFFADMESPEMFEHGKIARNLLEDNGFAMHWPYPSNSLDRLELHAAPPDFEGAFIPPVNPYILYFVMNIFGDNSVSYLLLMIINAIFSSLSVVFTYLIALKLFNYRAAVISGIISMLFLPNAFGCTTFSGSPLYQLLAIAILYYLVRFVNDKKQIHLVFASILLGLQVLTRSEFLMLGMLMLILTFGISYAKKTYKTSTLTKQLFLSMLIVFTIISPWMYRNTQLFGKFVPVVSHPWHEIWRGNNNMATGGAFGKNNESIWLSINHSPHLIDKLDSLEYNAYFEISADSVFKDEAVTFIKANPIEYLKLSTKRMLFLWTVDIYTPRAKSLPYVFFLLITIPAGI